MTILKQSPHGSFQVTQLAESVAICEAVKGDRFDWGNATEDQPAFIVYLGCQKDEVAPLPPIKGEITKQEWLNRFGNKQTQKV